VGACSRRRTKRACLDTAWHGSLTRVLVGLPSKVARDCVGSIPTHATIIGNKQKEKVCFLPKSFQGDRCGSGPYIVNYWGPHTTIALRL